jgi:PEP-CTERM motif
VWVTVGATFTTVWPYCCRRIIAGSPNARRVCVNEVVGGGLRNVRNICGGVIMTNCSGRVIAALSFLASFALTPMAHAGTYSAFATVIGTGPGCNLSTGGGGYGAASANVPSTPCTYEDPAGDVVQDSVAASGSWVTGDFSVFGETNTAPNGASNPSNQVQASDTFSDSGVITLPKGMTTASVTFGVTGLSGTAAGTASGTAKALGAYATADQIELQINGVASLACDNAVSINSPCSANQLALGFGKGALPPITVTVTNGETLSLEVSLEVSAYAFGFAKAQGSIVVDPLYLTLSPGVTFDSGVPNFLSGAAAPAAVPEPSIWAMMLVGFAGLGFMGWRGSRKASVPA